MAKIAEPGKKDDMPEAEFFLAGNCYSVPDFGGWLPPRNFQSRLSLQAWAD